MGPVVPSGFLRAAARQAGLGLWVLFLAACAHAAPPGTDAGLRTAEVEDILKVEGLGMAAFTPDGRWLAYNLLPPYAELSDYSYWVRAGGLSGHRLWVHDLQSDGAPMLQPGLDPGATNFLAGFSPDGAYVVSLEHRLGRYRWIACRTGMPDCAAFEAMPDIRDGYVSPAPWNERLAWVSDGAFVMPTRPADQPGSEMRSRAATGRYLWARWQDAWAGQVATGSEVTSTGRDRSRDWDTGTLVRFDLASGEERVLTQGRFAGVRVSPDTRWIAAARAGTRRQPAADAGPAPSETHPMYDRRYVLHLIDPGTGAVREIGEPYTVDPHSLTWSADGKRLAVYGWGKGQSPETGAFYILVVDTLEIRRVETGAFEIANAQFRPNPENPRGPARTALLENGLAVFARAPGTDRFGWYVFDTVEPPVDLSGGLEVMRADLVHSGRNRITVLAQDGAYHLSPRVPPVPIVAAGGGRLRPLAYSPQVSHAWSNEFRFDSARVRNEFDRSGALIASSPGGEGETEVHFVDPGTDSALSLHVRGARVLAASPRARAAVASVKSGAETRLLLIRESGPPKTLARINAHLSALRHPEVIEVSYDLRIGDSPPRRIETCLMVPAGYDPKRAYPLVIEPYPIGVPLACNSLADVPGVSALVPDLWTSRGFAYVRPPIPLDLARTPDGPVAAMPEIIDQTLEALVLKGITDPGRVVLVGYSQGGISALYTAAGTSKVSAVIAMNGWADFLSHYFGGRGLMRYFHLARNGGDDRWRYECLPEGAEHRCPFGFGAPPFEAPLAYVQNSPVVRARDITAPVLLIHSDLDYFDMSQFDEMFGALYRAGKEARYVRYWGEGHGPSSPANIRDLWARIDSFLEEHGIMDGAARADPDCSGGEACASRPAAE